jgi:protoporphyrinogen/coproporphyrinogen III oxidase
MSKDTFGVPSPPSMIYYPDRLVRIDRTKPIRTILDAIGQPLFKGALSSIWNMTKGNGATKLAAYEDVSIGDYFTNIFGRRDLVDNLLSALCHGVYGGDVYNLSMASSMFRDFWFVSKHGLKSNKRSLASMTDVRMATDLWNRAEKPTQLYPSSWESKPNWLVYVQGGIERLAESLAKELRSNENVTIQTETPITSIDFKTGASHIQVRTLPYSEKTAQAEPL